MDRVAPTGTLDGWAARVFAADGIEHRCYERGEGPGVVLVPEAPGITPQVVGLADHLVDEGFTVVVPSLFGRDGEELSAGYAVNSLTRICISREFRAFARHADRPVAVYLRALSRDLAARTPGRGVGVIGMCFTGGFALAAAADDVVSAPVLSQPSVPFPISRAHRSDPGVSPTELERVRQRAESDGLCVLGLRFSRDRAAAPERFETLRRSLGDAFEVIELDSGDDNPDGYRSSAHSVLTGEVRTDPPNSASRARDRVVAFLRERLAPEG
jgi:dienelactone hydrolase